jgi:hypothetical protein
VPSPLASNFKLDTSHFPMQNVDRKAVTGCLLGATNLG